ncbi:MAG: ABC-F family ATP-binding cassette domain-containing protein [Flavobacteriales bacterium]|jgi:ATP-binding cassette subfamily F protein uup
MNVLSVENLSKSFGERILFEGITFGIDHGQKVALVAKNGAGKTTLLRCLYGKESPDSGNIVFRKEQRIAWMDQGEDYPSEVTVWEVVSDNYNPSHKLLSAYNSAILSENDQEVERLSHEITAIDGWGTEAEIARVLSILKLDPLAEVSSLSGGQKKRISLAKVLLAEADFMVLDEPTNHLDLDMIEWLESYLSSHKATVFMVTHDRYFLEAVCDVILELEDKTLYKYNGNFSYYLFKKAERQEQLASSIEKAKNTFRTELEWIRRQPKARGTKQKARIDAFLDVKEAASRKIDTDGLQLAIKMERLGTKIVEFHNVKKAFGNKKILDSFSYNFQRKERLGIVGNNGTGKTTFVKLLLGEILPEGGKIVIGDTLVFGHYTQDIIQFKEDAKVIDIVKEVAEFIPLEKGRQLSAAQLLERFLFPRDMHYQFVTKLSGGEKRRLKLLRVLMANPNFLVLDEPTNDLDIFSMAALENYLEGFEGCLVVISHDRYFMDKITDHLFVFEGEGNVVDIMGNYTAYRLNQRKVKATVSPLEKPKETKAKEDKKRLSYKEQIEFLQLEKDIPILEQEKEELSQSLSSGQLSNDALISIGQQLGALVIQLETKTNRWLELAEME